MSAPLATLLGLAFFLAFGIGSLLLLDAIQANTHLLRQRRRTIDRHRAARPRAYCQQHFYDHEDMA